MGMTLSTSARGIAASWPAKWNTSKARWGSDVFTAFASPSDRCFAGEEIGTGTEKP